MEEKYTEVLCDASKDLLCALSQTPQRYIPLKIQGCMQYLRKAIGVTDDKEKIRLSSDEIEGEAEQLMENLTFVECMPNTIMVYVHNLQNVIQEHSNLAS